MGIPRTESSNGNSRLRAVWYSSDTQLQVMSSGREDVGGQNIIEERVCVLPLDVEEGARWKFVVSQGLARAANHDPGRDRRLDGPVFLQVPAGLRLEAHRGPTAGAQGSLGPDIVPQNRDPVRVPCSWI